MTRCRSWACLALMAIVLPWGIGQAQDQAKLAVPSRRAAAASIIQRRARAITTEQRLAAARRAKAARQATQAVPLAVPLPGGTPNYFGPEPNWANSPAPTVDPVTGAISGGIHKFVDSLPQLYSTGANNLGNYIPVAIPDTSTYSDCDYYEIELGQYTQEMHTDLLPTTLRGYRQTNTSDPTVSQFYYVGPVIVAQKNRPVRIKFTNKLPIGAGGDLFLPVDKTVMGAGMGPLGMNVTPGNQMDYTQNRATLHLHGGLSPWISDGTIHQWITPAGENTDYPKGVSVQNVLDMPDPGPGSMTFFYSNQQSARLMFYHDHSYGITRLNVYAGEAAGYVLRDSAEQDLITRGVIPDIGIPLVIQDRTFVDPSNVLTTDPTWPFPLDVTKSNLWYPHVYMPNQNPNDLAGVNAFGRWDYGPWFWPPWPAANPPITLPDGTVRTGVPDLSETMEAFHDTPVVNGAVYPYLDVQPRAYRFRILNAANDRGLNLQLYVTSSIVAGIKLTGGGSGYTTAPTVTITPAAGDTAGKGATALATVDLTAGSPTFGHVTAVTLVTTGTGYTLPPIVAIAPPSTVGGLTATATATLYSAPTEVGMVPAIQGTASFPVEWTVQTPGQPGDILDGRTGGVPDPDRIGPSMIQIGTEGGFLPAPVIWPNIPTGFDRDPKSITVGNVKEHNLLLGPAERADVIIDFSAFAGKTLILYNDAPAAHPAPDARLDYYTGNMDLTSIGGAPVTLPGYGPNTRTIMQIRVANIPPAPAYNLTTLNNEFASTSTTQGVFARSQEPIIVPQAPYNSAYNASFPSGTTAYVRLQNTSLTFTPMGSTTPMTITFNPKAIAEEFESTYGRMSAFLGVELPFTNGMNQTTIFYTLIDPPTEVINDSIIPLTPVVGDGTQIWYIVHNGVDTHPVHFHLFNVQLVNRVDWAGVVKPPDPNELGWKETLRMNPLENCIVALRPVAPKTPWGQPDSIRPYNPTMPLGDPTGFKNVDPLTGNPIVVTNQLFNFGWEYMWHCHILSHEEMDMMRPIVFNVGRALPAAPVLTYTRTSSQVNLAWTDATPAIPFYPLLGSNWGNPANEIGFRIERATVSGGNVSAYTQVGSALANATTYADTTAASATTYSYRIVAYNAAGSATSAAVTVGPATGLPAAPTNLVASLLAGPQITLTWRDNATNETGFVIERSLNGGAFATLATVGPRNNTGTVSYTDLAVTPGNTYAYRVKAVNGGGSSAYSNTATVTIAGVNPPAAPTFLGATLQAGPKVALTWRDNATNETGFVVERAANSGAFAQIVMLAARAGTGAISYTDTTVLPGNTYTYRVKAVNTGGSSAYSNVAGVTVPALPAAPSGLVATAARVGGGNNDRITLNWVDNSGNETGFRIQRATNGIFTAGLTTSTVAANTMAFQTGNVPRGTSYWFRVQAFNASGASAWSNVASIITP